MIHRGSMNMPWAKQIITKANDMENDETKRYQEDLDPFREVSEWFGKWEEGGVRHASLELLRMENCIITMIYEDITPEKHEMDYRAWFCNHKTTYPAYLPSIFSSFCIGALGLADPDYPFLFLLSLYLSLHLFLPRAQIKQLGSFVSLSIYKSAKIELFGQIMTLYILKQEIET